MIRSFGGFVALISVVGMIGSACPVFAQRTFPGHGSVLDWNRATASFDLAEEDRRAGKFDDAIEKYRIALKIYPNDPVFYCRLANALESAGRAPEAEQTIRNGLSRDPNSAETWTELARLLVRLGRKSEAAAAFKQSFASAPQDFRVAMTYGEFLLAEKKAQEADSIFRSAQSLAKTEAEKQEVKRFLLQPQDEKAPPAKGSVRVFRIKVDVDKVRNSATMFGVDGLFAYTGPPGKSFTQKGAQQVQELLLIDKTGRRMQLLSQEVQVIIQRTGLRGLRAKGWAGEVRPVPVTETGSDGSGSQFVVPPPI